MGKAVLGKWGIYILAPQVLIGFIVYNVTFFSGMNNAGEYAFTAAGIVAAVCIVITAFEQNVIGVIMAAASLTAVLLALSAIDGINLLTCVFMLLMFAMSYVSALLAKHHDDKSPTWFLVLCAVPIIGVVICKGHELIYERA